MAVNTLTEKSEERSVQTREETRAPERFVRPAVNIVEDEEGLTLRADIPGADRQSLNVNVQKGVLTISAPAEAPMPGRPVYTEYEVAPYYRQFSIAETLDHEKASADLTNGVLTIRIPKAAAAKPRRIEIQSA
uniref:Hsp20/alpha crystallin family protein n=1 Tax=Geobacter metallireducens TaxID=28232 RepID=A0A831XE13_GEOME